MISNDELRERLFNLRQPPTTLSVLMGAWPCIENDAMIQEKLICTLRAEGIPYVAVCKQVDVDAEVFELWIQDRAQISDAQHESIHLCLDVMLEHIDESASSIDWHATDRIKPVLDAKIASYRRARSEDHAISLGEDIP